MPNAAVSPPDPVAVGRSAAGCWAWVGVRVVAATDLTADRSFAPLPPRERARRALGEQQAWLRGLAMERDAAVETRWAWDPAVRRTTVVVVGRVMRADEAEARDAGRRLLARLQAVPPHVVVEALPGASIAELLAPFEPHALGAAEIRMRTILGRPNRPDAGVERYWMPQPLRVSADDWSTLLQQVTGLGQPVTLGVALEPAAASALANDLDRFATLFSRLARDGEGATPGLYAGPQRLAPEPFAVDAQKVYADLARRLRGPVLRMRIAVASPEPLDDGVLELLASTISPPDDSLGETYLNRELAGSAASVVRPAPSDLATFAANLASIGLSPWGGERPPAPFDRVAAIASIVDPLEASAAFRLPIATNGVLPGFPVRRPEFAVEVAAATDGDGLLLGEQLVGGQAAGEIRVPLDDLTMHGFIVGTTGSGKTSTVLGLCDQLWRDHGIPFLVLEPVNTAGDDYRWLLSRPGFEGMLVLTAGDDTVAPFRLNPLEVPAGVRVGEHIANLLACFDAAFGLWDPLPAIYRTALERTYIEAGASLDDSGGAREWPTIEAFAEEMRLATEHLEYAGEVRSNIIAASRVRVDQLRGGAARSVFDCRRSTPLDLVVSRPVVVELGRVGAGNDQELALVIALLLNALVEHRRAAPAGRGLVHVTVVEEAHKLLRRPAEGRSDDRGDAAGASARLFANVLAEIRKYGEGLLVADQDPAKLVADAYKNTNLKVMHRLPDEHDRALVGATMRFDADHTREAAGLRRFHAFVHAEGFERPALVRTVNPRMEDVRALPGDEELRARYRVARTADPALDASVAPYAECAGCPAVCVHRARASAAAATRATSGAFAAQMRQWEPAATSIAKDGWWDAVAALMAGLQGPASVQGASSDPRADRRAFEGCAFMHLMRGAYRRDRTPWIEEWRRRTSPRGVGDGTTSVLPGEGSTP